MDHEDYKGSRRARELAGSTVSQLLPSPSESWLKADRICHSVDAKRERRCIYKYVTAMPVFPNAQRIIPRARPWAAGKQHFHWSVGMAVGIDCIFKGN